LQKVQNDATPKIFQVNKTKKKPSYFKSQQKQMKPFPLKPISFPNPLKLIKSSNLAHPGNPTKSNSVKHLKMEENDIGRVIVVCRFRPLNEKEQQQSKSICVDFSEDHKSAKINSQYENGEDMNFTFDHIFPPSGSQEEVYKISARPVIDSIFQGFNGTVLAYGQTSSGKTYTMTGYSSEDPGIIPRMISDLFDFISNSDPSLEFTVKVSFCEIYLEKIKDLIDPNKENLRIQEDKAKGVHMPELTETYVVNPEEVMEIMKIGTSNREVSYTQMNATSSRSHSIFIVNVGMSNSKDYSAKSAKLYLVDLAGSEKVGKTGAAGKRLEEAKNINKSLTTLGQVITALTDPKASHVPYRDSKLTRVLQDSLGGNAKTTLILTCSPSPWNEAETISTLRFGNRAKAIKNKPKVNREYTVSELKLMLMAAKEEIQKKEKIIESLRGLDLNESKDIDRSLSCLNLCPKEVLQTAKELDRAKESLANEVRKSLKLQIEQNEIQQQLEIEKRELGKTAVQLTLNKNTVKILEEEIAIRDENIRIHAVKIAKIQQDLEDHVKFKLKSEKNMKEFREDREKIANELKNLQQQVIEKNHIECQNHLLKSELEFENNNNSRLQQEVENLRIKLEEATAKAPNIEMIKESVGHSIRIKERRIWDKEKKQMLREFEDVICKSIEAGNEAQICKDSLLHLQTNFKESEQRLKHRITALEKNNLQLKQAYDELELKYSQIAAEWLIEKEKKQEFIKKHDNIKTQFNLTLEKLSSMQEKFSKFLSTRSAFSESESHIFQQNIKKTIKGGQFLKIPQKDLTKTISSPLLNPSENQENFYNIIIHP
jgi:kinesin family protein 5